MVMGPTPPGTGVIYDALGATFSKSTSPTSLYPRGESGSSTRLMPTSMMTAPSLTISAVSNLGLPAATMMISAVRHIDLRSRVFEWQTVTVASPNEAALIPGRVRYGRCIKRSAIGLPTIFDLPITTTCFPSVVILYRARSSRIPRGVALTIDGKPCTVRPTLAGVSPSTSFR